ncbi:MAG: hypothetical protein GHCLOJNM_00191 [bacterium]|nr:hypothetical protein [bacterium]
MTDLPLMVSEEIPEDLPKGLSAIISDDCPAPPDDCTSDDPGDYS